MCINVQTKVNQALYDAIRAELDNVYCDAVYYDHFGHDSYHFSDGSFVTIDLRDNIIIIFGANIMPNVYASPTMEFHLVR